MTKNVGKIDAGIRVVLGAGFLLLAATFSQRPLPAISLALVALILFGTALSRTCPLYSLLGIYTCPNDSRPSGS